MEVHINNYDPTLAPAGKTVISISYYTQNADYWINLRQSDPESYQTEKQKFAQIIIDLADARLGGFKEKIEVIDIATPATFQRYTNNWKGSVQGWLPGKNIIAQSPVKSNLPGLNDFYFIGHWTIPGGGLPVAIKSAWDEQRGCCTNNLPQEKGELQYQTLTLTISPSPGGEGVRGVRYHINPAFFNISLSFG